MNKTLKIIKIFFLGLILFFSNNAVGQEHHEKENEAHDFKRFVLFVNIGQAFNPTASLLDSKVVIIPTFGLDIQYWFNHKWGIGLKNDLEVASYLVENANNENYTVREYPFIISLPVFFSPWETNGLTFFMGPGIELESHKNFSVFRFGLGYEVEIAGDWNFAPELVYDLKNGHINSFTIAMAIGKRF